MEKQTKQKTKWGFPVAIYKPYALINTTTKPRQGAASELPGRRPAGRAILPPEMAEWGLSFNSDAKRRKKFHISAFQGCQYVLKASVLSEK